MSASPQHTAGGAPNGVDTAPLEPLPARNVTITRPIEAEGVGTNPLAAEEVPTVSAVSDLSPKLRVGPFTLFETYGTGGFATVSLGLNTTTGTTAAVKHLKPYCDDPRVAAMLQAEGQTLLALEQAQVSGVPRVLEMSEPDAEEPYLALGILLGESYFTTLRKFHVELKVAASGPIQVNQLQILRQNLRDVLETYSSIVQIIGDAAKAGYLHLDIKPGNIRRVTLDLNKDVEVLDWGLAAKLDGSSIPASFIPERLPTERGAAVGSFEYMSPEQKACRRDLFTEATAVFQLGEVLGDLLAGPPASDPESPTIPLRRSIEKGRSPLPAVWPTDLWDGLVEIYTVATRAIPAKRFQTCEHLVLNVREVVTKILGAAAQTGEEIAKGEA